MPTLAASFLLIALALGAQAPPSPSPGRVVGRVVDAATGEPLIEIVAGAGAAVPEIRLDRGGVITGRVLDAKGNPLSRVTVQAQPLSRLPNGTVRPIASASSADTNALGEFRLAGLPPGQHYVSAERRPISPFNAGPPPAAAATYVPTYYPGFAEMAAASPVDVVKGAMTNGIDFALMAVAALSLRSSIKVRRVRWTAPS